jgi:hypothetical protein
MECIRPFRNPEPLDMSDGGETRQGTPKLITLWALDSYITFALRWVALKMGQERKKKNQQTIVD